MKKKISLIIILVFSIATRSQSLEIDYPDPEIKKIIIEGITMYARGMKAEDIFKKFNWKKYQQKDFKNIDCKGNIHKGIVIYYPTKSSENAGFIAIFIELKNNSIVKYHITEDESIDKIINEILNEPYFFNTECLGDW